MPRHLRRPALRLAALAAVLVLAHLGGFLFAAFAQRAQATSNPFFASTAGAPFQERYLAAVRALFSESGGALPRPLTQPLLPTLVQAAGASGLLIALAFPLSIGIGVWLGRRASRINPPGIAAGLIAPGSLALALPAFVVGAALIGGAIALSLATDRAVLIPFSGFQTGWGLLLPVLALAIRPTFQLAQFTAGLLAAEAGKPYARAAHSLGFDDQALRGRLLFRNILLPVLAQAGNLFRLIVAELVVVEWLFDWPGVGRLLANALIPARLSNAAGETPLFLHAPLLAGLAVVFAALFFTFDTLAHFLARRVDPRVAAPPSP